MQLAMKSRVFVSCGQQKNTEEEAIARAIRETIKVFEFVYSLRSSACLHHIYDGWTNIIQIQNHSNMTCILFLLI
jgi:hypothetical protein